ncbi:hypothetical protein [uncultured Aquimarina sp.]|uniref:hypothetical protein n=1 Tax=uncultured Aquimarina sp. TaxID=575652 RepID=UPI00261A5A5E|nr:hypothetical protein [uncultured Aquimarina sp.]
MKNLILLLFTFTLFCTSCNNDDDGDSPLSEKYTMKETNNSGISGSVFFEKPTALFSDDIFFISVELTGVELEGSYTANIYNNSLLEDGDIAFTLNSTNNTIYNLEDSNVLIISNTFHSFNQLIIDNEILNYQELIAFDGHIKIFNDDDPSIVLAEGNIGSNAP